jgi:hypothetical protein
MCTLISPVLTLQYVGVYPERKVHRQVNNGAKQLSVICSLPLPPEDVIPELVTVGGFDEHL